jgi:hypothetical protein
MSEQVKCRCIAPTCGREQAGMGPAEYCQLTIARDQVLEEMVAEGLIERSVDADGTVWYRGTPKLIGGRLRQLWRRVCWRAHPTNSPGSSYITSTRK